MDRNSAENWLKVWDQAHKPGSVVDWLTWLAENGYSLVQGQPTEPMDADDVWALVANQAAEGMDETPTVCAAAECGRTRPRWTMELVGGQWVCNPANAMHCGVCCKPGEYLTHYTEEEHQHSTEERTHADAEKFAGLERSLMPALHCVRCGRKYRPDERAELVDAGNGQLKCKPGGTNYDACMRQYNTV
jgi:hypothetical protein